MTGATIIAKKGGHCAFISVRHSGYDTNDFLPTLDLSQHTPESVCLSYLEQRLYNEVQGSKDPDDFCSLDGELDLTLAKKVFTFDLLLSDPFLRQPEKLYDKALNLMEPLEEWDDYLCSYRDYFHFVDLDKGVIKDGKK